MTCYSCKSISGEARISPGPIIYEGEYWIVDHAYPCALEGWLVLVLKRHAEALHELSQEEFSELGELQQRTVKALRELLRCEKEYIACFSEAEHFKHIHVHIIPRPRDLSPEQRGPGVFSFLKVSANEAVPPERVRRISLEIEELLKRNEF